MKIGIVGLGYWGNNIHRSLRLMGYDDTKTCDPKVCGVDFSNYEKLSEDNITHVFVATPASSHNNICRHFLQKGINVFCEKPLSLSLETCNTLYSIAEENNCNLFVDWIYTFNAVVRSIKSFILNSDKTPKNIIINRLNKGPSREDVSARWDLASHDVAVSLYLLGNNSGTKWMDFNRDTNSGFYWDSVTGVLSYDQTTVQINCSWAYDRKVRDMIFEFEDGFIKWDELAQTIESTVIEYDTDLLGGEVLEAESPLVTAIETFINKSSFNYQFQKQITLDTTRILSYEC